MHQHALDERHALAETLRRVGPIRRTLVRRLDGPQLAAHLVLRERSVVEAAGRLPVAALQRRAEQVVDDLAARDAVRPARRHLRAAARAGARCSGPVPVAWLWSLPPVRELANLLEYLVHHEDVRRAQPTWHPRRCPSPCRRRYGSGCACSRRSPCARCPWGVELRGRGTASRSAPALRGARRSRQRHRRPGEVALFAFGRLRWPRSSTRATTPTSPPCKAPTSRSELSRRRARGCYPPGWVGRVPLSSRLLLARRAQAGWRLGCRWASKSMSGEWWAVLRIGSCCGSIQGGGVQTGCASIMVTTQPSRWKCRW